MTISSRSVLPVATLMILALTAADAKALGVVDAGMRAGVGLERRTSGATWSPELLYRHALTDLAEESPPTSSDVDGLSLMVGRGF